MRDPTFLTYPYDLSGQAASSAENDCMPFVGLNQCRVACQLIKKQNMQQ